MPDYSPSSTGRALMALWALSGFSTLTFELVWMREMALWAGNTVTASALVIAVFFACAACGNLLGAGLMRRRSGPLRCYARFEMLAALTAIISLAASRWLWQHSEAMPSGWLLRVGMALLLVGPASFCSGVAFPSLAESFVPSARERASTGAVFYGLNLLGAALGVAAGGVLLPWQCGIEGTFGVAAAVQFTGGLMAWRISRGVGSRPIQNEPETTPEQAGSSRLGWTLLAMSGALSLATQSLLLLWTRQALEGSIYAMSAVVGVFVCGLGLGALTVGALRRRGAGVLKLLSAFAGAASLALFMLPWIGLQLSVGDIAVAAQSPVMLMVETFIRVACVLLPLTFSLGGVFPLAWELTGAAGAGEGDALGKALALNKLGSALGVALGLFALMPVAGLVGGALAIAWGYALIALVARRPSWQWSCGLVIIGLWQTMTPHGTPGVTSDLRVVASLSGPYGPVTVVEDVSSNSRQILLNSRQRLSGTRNALPSQQHQSWVPLLLCPQPKRVLTIGMAAGISAAAALDFPIEHLDAVELVPEVVTAARAHFGPWNAALFGDPRAHVITDDGRHTLSQSRSLYDAIICDLFFPSEEGTAHLYSREFFSLARSRLSAAGVFCVWLPCYQHSAATTEIVVRTFLEAFPNAIMVRSSLDPLQPIVGLIGSNQKLLLSAQHFDQRLAAAGLIGKSPFMRSGAHAQMLVLGDLRAAEPGFDSSMITTDDHPVFAFLGPRMIPSKERLFGVTFLNWAGKRFPRPSFPSCDLGETSADDMLAAIRAANHYLATAVAATVLPDDPRPAMMREQQTQSALERARTLRPATPLGIGDLGR